MTVTSPCPRCHGISKLSDGLCPYCLLQATVGLAEQSAMPALAGVTANDAGSVEHVTKSQSTQSLDGMANVTMSWSHGERACPPKPGIPGYEILKELGHGGMGVVYKARHKKLGHIVALKMILADTRARMQDLERFVTEAQAVARLRHPNIVQIYELGEHDGMPYFTLEYCEGGSLAERLKEPEDAPVPAKEAADLIATVARAIDYAHQHNISTAI